ncbi:MAG: phospholipase D family protein [Candidatus Acidiferrales bacterium]
MLQFLGSEDVWRTLRAISRSHESPLYVAVPYMGDDCGKLLSLKRGDVLVVALTEANSRNGSVCPDEIARLQKTGVAVFLSSYLHAKVLLCGNKAVVGSANLSKTSAEYLDEAAIVTTDALAIRQIREWFRQRMAEPVTPKWLSICSKVYQPPKGGIRGKAKRTLRERTGQSVWILGLRHTIFPQDEAVVEKRGASQAKREVSDVSRFKIDSVRWTGTPAFLDRMRKGDTVIQVMQNAGPHYAEEAARLVGKRNTQSRRGTPVTYLYLECNRRPKRIPWAVFKKYCRSINLKLARNTGGRELTRSAQAAKVVAFVSRRTQL